jgi:(1->4)-alpha-D-glucan 1-alpha-D-glucosylmutase
VSGSGVAPTALWRWSPAPGEGLDAAAGVLAELSAAGVSHVVVPQLLVAAPGADRTAVADHRQVDPALGGEEALRALSAAARQVGVGLVAGLVVDRMAVGAANPVWDALLREGRSSEAARWVDVDYATPLPGAADKVILPVLDGPYGDELAAGRLGLAEDAGGGVRVTYGARSFPLEAASEDAVRRSGVDRLAGRAGEPRTWTRMHSLLEQQRYRLVSAGAGRRLVNYGRVEDDDDLAVVRVEDPIVFEAVHRVPLALLADGVLDGLLVHRLDGLADPAGYLARLRAAVGPDAWVGVRGALPAGVRARTAAAGGVVGHVAADRAQVDPDAVVPASPPAVAEVDGADASDVVPHLDAAGVAVLADLAAAHGAAPDGPARAAIRAGALDARLGPDLRRLARAMWEACQAEPAVRDVDYRTLLDALSRVLVALPVDRTHLDPTAEDAHPGDVAVVDAAIAAARAGDDRDRVPEPMWRWLHALLRAGGRRSPAEAEAVVRAQQLSAALAAVAGRQVQLRDGGLPVAAASEGAPGPAAWGLVGEDLRLRVAALASAAGGWRAAADALVAGTDPPDAALALRLLALAVGGWPADDDGTRPLADVLGGPDGGGPADRLAAHARACAAEVARGAGRVTPDPDAVGRLEAWVRALLDPDGAAASQLRPFAVRAAEVGMAAGLSQLLQRLVGPTPVALSAADLSWDLRLSPPDGAPPATAAGVAVQPAPTGHAAELWARRRDGAVKAHVLAAGLRVRADHAPAVAAGDAAVLPARGRWAAHVAALVRQAGGAGPVVAVCPRQLGPVTDGGRFPPLGRLWADTEVDLPPPAGDGWLDVLSGRTHPAAPAAELADLLVDLPVALLVPSRG